MSGSEWGTKWGKKRVGGREYDLGHLDPFPFHAIPGDKNAPRIAVGVSFRLHTFTRDREGGDSPDLFMGNANDPRSFCPQRHECSLRLPDIIRGIADKNVWLSGDSYMIVSQIDCAAKEYATIFYLAPAAGELIRVRMHVISAHERKNPLPLSKMKQKSFYSLARQVFQDAGGDLQKETAPSGAASGIQFPSRESVAVNDDDAVALRTSRFSTRQS